LAKGYCAKNLQKINKKELQFRKFPEKKFWANQKKIPKKVFKLSAFNNLSPYGNCSRTSTLPMTRPTQFIGNSWMMANSPLPSAYKMQFKGHISTTINASEREFGLPLSAIFLLGWYMVQNIIRTVDRLRKRGWSNVEIAPFATKCNNWLLISSPSVDLAQ
jgi:hypothetical protein